MHIQDLFCLGTSSFVCDKICRKYARKNNLNAPKYKNTLSFISVRKSQIFVFWSIVGTFFAYLRHILYRFYDYLDFYFIFYQNFKTFRLYVLSPNFIRVVQ